MSIPSVEQHPFELFIPEGSKIILCGTFPPKPEKWAMDFFYPNFQNDMWRIFGLIYFNDKEHFFDKTTKTVDKAGIQAMLRQHHIGMGETARAAIRTKDNASDKFLEIVKPVDLPALLEEAPECEIIATTGEKAASVVAGLTQTELPAMGQYKDCAVLMKDGTTRKFLHWRLPSTSRAFPMALEKKKQYYLDMLMHVGLA